MKSSIEVFVQFDFKGETLSPSLKIDLDEMMSQYGEMPVLYPLLARHNNIGLYSYELEVMESLPIQGRDAEGLAAQFVVDGLFDQQGFERAWLGQQAVERLRQLALEHMDGELLEQHPQIIQALQAAYQLGREANR